MTHELRRGEVLGVRLAGRLEAALGRIAALEGQLSRTREANKQYGQLVKGAPGSWGQQRWTGVRQRRTSGG